MQKFMEMEAGLKGQLLTASLKTNSGLIIVYSRVCTHVLLYLWAPFVGQVSAHALSKK